MNFLSLTQNNTVNSKILLTKNLSHFFEICTVLFASISNEKFSLYQGLHTQHFEGWSKTFLHCIKRIAQFKVTLCKSL